MLDSPPLHSIDKLSSPSLDSIDKLSSPPVSAQLVGLFAELIHGCTYLNNKVRSDIDDLKARLSSLDESRTACTSESASEVDKTESTPPAVEKPQITDCIGASRQLCRAIVRNDVELVRKNLGYTSSLATKQHPNGWYPIHAAVLTENLEMVKLIVENCEGKAVTYKEEWKYDDSDDLSAEEFRLREEELGAKAKTTKTEGCRPLHFACLTGNADIIKYLVEEGASFDDDDYKNREPHEYLDLEQHPDTAKVYFDLRRYSINRDWEFKEASFDDCKSALRGKNLWWFERQIKGHPEYAKQLTYYDFYLLHCAVIRQQPKFVELLIEADKDVVNYKDVRSNYDSDSSHSSFANDQFPHRFVKDATPLHYACLTGNLEIIEMLLKAGADWTLTDWKDRTPEQVIFDDDGDDMTVKEAFIKLRDEEDARRKAKEEEANKGEEEEDGAEKSSEKKEGNGDGEKEETEEKKDEPDDDKKSEKGDDDDGSQSSDDDESKPKTPNKPLEVILGDKVIGQKGPIRSVSSAIRLRENGWVDPDRPLVLLFLGSSGVGKTELAKQVALYMHGKESTSTEQSELVNELEQECGFIRVDMSEYQQSHTVANLTGSPKGYVGYDEGGNLTGQLRKNPKAIVLLDEIEKAHPDVLTVFLQVFDDGRITDPKNGVVYCKDAVFIMTSNLATEQIKRKSPFLRKLIKETEEQGRPEEYMRVINDFNREIYPQLKARLRRDEFLGRINQIVVFLPLDDEEIGIVIGKELDIWRRRAEEKHGIQLSWSREAVSKLTKAYDVNFGVRSVMHEVQRIAVQLIADAHIRGDLRKDWHAYLTVDELGDVTLRSANPTETVKVRRGCRFHLL